MRIIAVEEHFVTEEFIGYLRSRKEPPKREFIEDEKHHRIERNWFTPYVSSTHADPEQAIRPVIDVAEERLKQMDKAGISMQVLSEHVPGVEDLEAGDGITWAQKNNDALIKIIDEHPDRYLGLAALPLQEPKAAANELERAVRLGLKGAKVNSHVKNQYLDEEKYWIVFEKAEELGVPIFIHPKQPSSDMIKPFLAYPGLWSALWGFGADVGLHAMRLICSGLFDKYLKQSLPRNRTYWRLRLPPPILLSLTAWQRCKRVVVYELQAYFGTAGWV